jgi:diadenylate cyclase
VPKKDLVTSETLINATLVVELKANSREDAIRELVSAFDWSQHGVSDAELIAAIEEREATAQTMVAEDLAIPHASVDWDGDFRVILGRSRDGVPFGAKGEPVRLVVLLVIGRQQAARHLQVLATLAGLLQAPDFRSALIAAKNTAALLKLLEQKVAPRSDTKAHAAKLPELSVTLAQQAAQLARTLNVQALLLAVDRLASVPWQALSDWPGKILVVSTTDEKAERPDRPNVHVFEVPHAGLSRIDRANLGMLLAASNDLLPDQSDVVCVTGPPGERLDCIAVIRPADKFHAIFDGNIERGTARIPPAVILRVISLAIELASEGR